MNSSGWTALSAFLVRNIRQEGRNLTSGLIRLGLLAVCLLFLMGTMEGSLFTDQAAGARYLSGLLWIGLGFITLSGLSYFSASIAEEKEEETLGLLRMTGLGPLSLLLGKAGARVIVALQYWLICLPLALLAVALGGVDPSQLWAGVLCLGAWMLAMAGLGVFASVLMSTPARASSLTVLLMVGLVGFPYLLLVAQFYAGTHPDLARFCLSWSEQWRLALPFERLAAVLDLGWRGSVWHPQLAIDAGLGLVGFGAAWLLFERCADPRREASPAARATGVQARSPRTIWSNPIAWKDFVFLGGGWKSIIIRNLLLVGLVLGLTLMISGMKNRSHNFATLDWEVFFYLMLILGPISAGLELMLLCSRIFNQEWRDGTWPALYGIPRSLMAITLGKVMGGIIPVLPGLVWTLMAWNGTKMHWHFTAAETALTFSLSSFALLCGLLGSLLMKRSGFLVGLISAWLGWSISQPFFIFFLKTLQHSQDWWKMGNIILLSGDAVLGLLITKRLRILAGT